MQVKKKTFSSPCTVDLICFSIPDKKSSDQNDIPFKDISFSKFHIAAENCGLAKVSFREYHLYSPAFAFLIISII